MRLLSLDFGGYTANSVLSDTVRSKRRLGTTPKRQTMHVLMIAAVPRPRHCTPLASTSIPLLIQIDIDRIGEIPSIVLTLLLRQRVPRNNLKCTLHIHIILRARLKIRHCAPLLTIGMRSLLRNHAPLFAHIHFVPQHHEREAVGVPRAGLDQELVAPGVEGLEGLGRVDVVDEDAAVGAAVEGDAEGLEAFLTGGVPELKGDDAVVNGYFFGEEVGAYGCFVGGGEFLVDLEGGLKEGWG